MNGGFFMQTGQCFALGSLGPAGSPWGSLEIPKAYPCRAPPARAKVVRLAMSRAWATKTIQVEWLEVQLKEFVMTNTQ